MSTTAPDPRISIYNPVAITTDFAAGFPVFDNSDISVTVNGVLRTDFTVTASYAAGISGDAKAVFNPGVTGKVVVYGTRATRRTNRFPISGPIAPSDLNYAFDCLEAEMQERQRDTQSSIRAAVGSSGFTLSGALVDGDTLMIQGSQLVKGPYAADIANAQVNAAVAQAASTAALGYRDQASAYAALAKHNFTRTPFVGDGVTQDFALTIDPGSADNLIIGFGSTLQIDGYSIITIASIVYVHFDAPPPNGIKGVIMYGSALQVGTPGDGTVTTIKLADKNTTLAKIQDVATGVVLGRQTAGSGSLEQIPFAQALPSGAVIDSAYAEYTANTGLTAVIPADNTVPQITEGTEILTVTLTPKSATNKFRIRFQGVATTTATTPGLPSWAIFKAGAANAIGSGYVSQLSSGIPASLVGEVQIVPGVTTPVTISVRAGPGNASTMTFNGSSGGPIHGGAMRATLTVEEIKV